MAEPEQEILEENQTVVTDYPDLKQAKFKDSGEPLIKKDEKAESESGENEDDTTETNEADEQGDSESGDAEAEENSELLEEDGSSDEEPSEKSPEEPSEDSPEDTEAPAEEPVEQPELDYAEETDGVFGSLDEIKEFAKTLKEDEYLKGAIDYYRKEGTLLPYLEVMKVNPDELSTQDLLRAKFDQEYQDIPKSDRDILFEEDVLKAYKLDGDEEYDERDVRLGKIRADKKAEEIRKELKGLQEKFKQPAREEQKGPTQEELIAERNKRRKIHADNVGQVLKNDSFSIDIADDVDSLPVKISKQKIIDYAMDFTKFAKDHLLRDGKVNYKTLADLTAFASDPAKYRKDVFDHGLNYGKKTLVNNDLKNKPTAEKGESKRSSGPVDPYKASPKDWKIKKR